MPTQNTPTHVIILNEYTENNSQRNDQYFSELIKQAQHRSGLGGLGAKSAGQGNFAGQTRRSSGPTWVDIKPPASRKKQPKNKQDK